MRFFLLLAAVAPLFAQPKSFVHPGILQSRQDLDFMKSKVAAAEQPWKQAWQNLLAQPYSSLDFQPHPVTHIVRGAYGRGSVGDRDLMSGALGAYSHALQWYITGDQAHARKAIEILNAWSAVLWDFEGNDAKLLAGWTGGNFCNAAEILRATNSGWQPKDLEQFKRLMRTVYFPLMRDFYPEANGNWDAAMIDSFLSIAIFCDDRALFDRAVEHFLRGGGNAGITRYVYPSGQCEENARDQGHTQLGLGYFARASQVAWTQGVDLYAAAGNRLALGYEFTARYMLGEDVPVYGLISPQSRGHFSDIYEAVYQHYHFVKGLDMPYTARAVEKARQQGWSALTMYRGPSPKPAPPVGPPHGTPQAPQAGAQSSTTAPAPSDATRIEPGQSIQSALDAKAGTGGWVVLAKGLHTLPRALHLPSGVTLAGEGRETILMLDPQRTGPAIVNATDDLHDVTLRDFILEGALVSHPPTDPNGDRMARSYRSAPSRAGIALSAQRAAQMRNLRLEHLTVRHCTHNGVAIRGAAQLAILACDFSDNGGSVVPGPGLEHNLLITRTQGAEVRDSRLDDSLWGSGLDLTFSGNVTVANNEAARNTLYGLHVAESETVQIRSNLIEGNTGGSIVLETLMDKNQKVETKDNQLQNNKGIGQPDKPLFIKLE
ncbi:MAG TPA: alginate lyase family protein [Bryobacteraceae bacterium]|jgi:parallel beta-helix repeat protein